MHRIALPISLLVLVGVASTRCTAAMPWRDAANGYTVEIPTHWVSVSPDVITMLNTAVGRYLRQNVRYSACFVPSGRTSQELPRMLVQFQPWEGGVPTLDALEQSLKEDVAPAFKKVQRESAIPISSIEVGDSMLDRENNRMVIRMRTSVPGDGMVDGISFGLLGKRGVVFLHCYGPSDKFAKMVPFFELVADTMKFDAGQTYDPAGATVNSIAPKGSSSGTFSFIGAGRGGLIGACVGGVIGAVAMVARYMRRRVW